MNKKNLLIITYNRPEKLKQVLSSINKKCIKGIYFYNNNYLYLKDKKKVIQCRELIKNFKFKGNKYYLFNQEHLKVKNSILKAIDWFFSHNQEGIILEDDIIPNHSFYLFCSLLLDRYRKNQKVFHISGFNHLEKIDSPFSYHFNYVTHVWGWATWKNRWIKFRKKFKNKSYKNENKKIFFLDRKMNLYRNYLYNRTLNNKIVTWDYLWDMFIRESNGLCIRPNLNLVKNIGFDLKATNTKFSNKKLKKIRTFNLKNIYHPKLIYYYAQSDNKYFNIYEKRNLFLKKSYDYLNDIFKKVF